MRTRPNHLLRLTRRGRRGCNRGAPWPPFRASEAGFTRTELLLICGIIVTLFAGFLAIQTRTNDSTHRVQCQRNLTQIGQAMSRYTMEHENMYPKDWNSSLGSPRTAADEASPTGFWCTQGYDAMLQPYLQDRRVFVCPGDVWLNQNLSSWGSRNNWDDTSYGINVRVQIHSVTSVAAPASTILLGHTRFEHTLFEDNRSVLWDTHQSGNNYLFCDGGVQFLTGPATLIPKNLWKNRQPP
jgi:prepilin-type processing-associated H-X9-DG protein